MKLVARSDDDRGRDRGEAVAAPELPRYELIEAMFFAYRDFVEDADRMLAGDGFGRAHHRVLYFAARRPGLAIAELLDILKITKQSLNRVLNDLLDRGYVVSQLGEADRRQRRLHATPRGYVLIDQIASIQSSRFARAFEHLDGDAEAHAAAFLAAMRDGSDDVGTAPNVSPRIGFLVGSVDGPEDFDRAGDEEIARPFEGGND